MVIKCPKCAEQFEIEPSWLNQRGVCPICQSVVLFSDREAKPAVRPGSVVSEGSRLHTAYWILCGLVLLFAIVGAIMLRVLLRERHERRWSRIAPQPYHVRNDIDSEKHKAKEYIDSLPAGQRDVFYGRSSSPADRANLYQNLMNSGNLDWAIRMLEE